MTQSWFSIRALSARSPRGLPKSVDLKGYNKFITDLADTYIKEAEAFEYYCLVVFRIHRWAPSPLRIFCRPLEPVFTANSGNLSSYRIGRKSSGALRGALGKTQGKLLMGVIGSIGKRRDPKAIVALEKLRHAEDVDVARAASPALARIRPTL